MFQFAHDIFDTVKYLNLARTNIVAAWPHSYYRKELIHQKILHKNLFVLNRPEDVQRVMVTNSGNYKKSLANRQALKPLLGDGVFVSEGKLWERQRKLMSPATHKSRLKGFASTMVDSGMEMVNRWQDSSLGEAVDLTEEMTLLTSDIITRTMFGVVLGERNHSLYQAF